MKGQNKNAGWLIGAGIFMLIAAASLTMFNLYEDFGAARASSEILDQLDLPEETDEVDPWWENVSMAEMPTTELGSGKYIGVLEIPVLSLELPIFAELQMELLRISPCRYTGSVYDNSMILAAHNYNSHFGRLSYLQPGDEVFFTDVDGVRWRYAVAYKETLDGTAVDEMESGDWDLTLFTCTYGGQARVTVRCEATGDSGNKEKKYLK